MTEKIKVQIKGMEYTLRGEDKEVILDIAEEVDSELKKIESSHINQPSVTVAILAALNIAEKRYEINKQKMIDEDYLINEINRMRDYISDSIINKKMN